MNIFLLLFSIFLLSSCSETLERLKRIGRNPELTKVELPNTEKDQEDIEIDQSRLAKHHTHMRKTNSLWQPGSTTFFRDNRAWRIGDILKVVVEIKDSAKLDNSTGQHRGGDSTANIPAFFGKEKAIGNLLSAKGDTNPLFQMSNKHNHNGSGNISRKENIKTEIAALVTKVLPNGNLVIQGHQEVRVNSELREIKVAGIIRPKDIDSNNSINSNQIAEVRISYGGRGVISDVQQPRVGSQVIDAISPF
jgi:flagellar L-ring protein precursor FlgH